MRHSTVFGLLAVVLLSCFFAACSQRDKVYGVSGSGDDTEMNAAIAKARETLPSFWRELENPQAGAHGFSLKVKITDKGETKQFWADGIERKDGKVFGTIDNDAEKFRRVILRKRIEIPDQNIIDWAFVMNKKMFGNYTFRVFMKRMPKDEADKYKAILENLP